MPFTSVDDVKEKLAAASYLASDAVATTVFLASELGKPLLVEGPAGVGKTELSPGGRRGCGAELVRLQCYEGVDEARALYEWNHAKQLLRITAGRDETWDAGPQRHLQRGVPALPPAAHRDPQRGRRCC